MFQLQDIKVRNVLKINHLIVKKQVTSIEGQSGSGKSTLLRLLNNLDDPLAGTITFKGKDITQIPACELRQKVVMAPQNPVIFDGSIRDNLTIGLKLTNQTIAKDKLLEEMLERFWLEKNLDTNSSDLSGGEKQRVALGRVLLMKKADVFLLDEPSSELDNNTTDHVVSQFIQKAKEQNQQIIMVTHDKHVTEKFADEVINMDTYRVQKESDVE